MFPRNKRRVSPWKLSSILLLLRDQIGSLRWAGNQALQDSFRTALEQTGLIRPGAPYDSKSGGPRTYEAQLRCLGLIFERKDSALYMTRAGDAIADGDQPLRVLQTQLLRHQYPSAYSSSRMVAVNPGLKVRPFVFVMELLADPQVDSLTLDELCMPVIYGHSDACYDFCKERILQLRSGKEVRDVLLDWEKDLYTPRTEGNSFESRWADVRDIANTLKNYMQAACLISIDKSRGGTETIHLSLEIPGTILALAREPRPLLRFSGSEEEFQRAYGVWDREKDTRTLGAATASSETYEANLILAHFFDYCGTRLLNEVPEEFVTQLHQRFGYDKGRILDVCGKHVHRTGDIFEAAYLEFSRGGRETAANFEEATNRLFRDRLYFDAKLTGQRKRAGGAKGGYADIFLIALDGKHCALIDTKATSYYSLPSDDYAKMLSNYMPNYTALCGERTLALEFVLYVAGGLSRNLDTELRKLADESKVPCSAIAATDLLTVCRRGLTQLAQPAVRSAFSLSGCMRAADFPKS